MSNSNAIAPEPGATSTFMQRMLKSLGIPFLAIILAFVLGGIVIWITSGSLVTVFDAFNGMLMGAIFKQRGLSESIVATVPYIFLSLGLAVGFKAGLFNIGVDGQFFIGAITAAYLGQAFTTLPAIIHLPIVLGGAALAGAIWAGIAGFLKARTGAHEVVTTIMMNYIAYRLTEQLVTMLQDPSSSAVQTPVSAKSAWIWSFYSVPERLQDPLNALGVGLLIAFLSFLLVRWIINRSNLKNRFQHNYHKNLFSLAVGLLIGILSFFLLPILTNLVWPFTDPYDRVHVGIILAILASLLVWWFLWRTTIGFELRTVGANPDAARYAGINITRSIVLAMAISGALAAIAGSIEVLGVATCHCQQGLFTTGIGFDAIAIALLAKNDPFGILAASFLFGSIRNGASLMEIKSGVSHYIVSLIQGFVLLFVSAPSIIQSLLNFRFHRPKQKSSLSDRSGD
jgi:general nucleoside transport system permease protein